MAALQYLAKHIRVMLYSGEFDLNTNILGTLRVLEQNTWLGRYRDIHTVPALSPIESTRYDGRQGGAASIPLYTKDPR